MNTLDQIKINVSKELKEFDNLFSHYVNSPVPLLNILINHIIRRKGKQFRPLLVYLSAKLHGEINNKTTIAATLIELLHTATLIHDDIVDETFERRGNLSVNALWKSKKAVLIGDYLLSQGMLIAINNNCFDLLKTISESVKDMSEAELLQITAKRKFDFRRETYFEIISKKTASLISACTITGSQTTTNDVTIHQKMKLFGKYLGIAFQIKDDIFDFQKSGIIGKPIGNDLIENKITLPFILSFEESSITEKKDILKMLFKKKDIQSVNEYIKRKKGIENSIQIMIEYKNKSLKILSDFDVMKRNSPLIDLVNYTIDRNL